MKKTREITEGNNEKVCVKEGKLRISLLNGIGNKEPLNEYWDFLAWWVG